MAAWRRAILEDADVERLRSRARARPDGLSAVHHRRPPIEDARRDFRTSEKTLILTAASKRPCSQSASYHTNAGDS